MTQDNEMPEEIFTTFLKGYPSSQKYVRFDVAEKALRVLERLESGDVSDEMIECGYSNGDGDSAAEVIFKAMVRQLLKEVRDE